MTVIDSHTHIFSSSVIANVSAKNGLADSLCLDIRGAEKRTDKAALQKEAQAAGIHASLLLPTAPAGKVREVNDHFLDAVKGEKDLFTAGTLHPFAPCMDEELLRLSSRGVRVLKFSSFSQGFNLCSDKSFDLFEKIQAHNLAGKPRLSVILDTFYRADHFFGASAEHVTTPEKLGRTAASFPGIDFVAAHMGGLAAPFVEIEQYLTPGENLYLDTSNAAHVLTREEFVRLLILHGPKRILFGTDWPWFGQGKEVRLVKGLLKEADFSTDDQSSVLGGNISRLLGHPL